MNSNVKIDSLKSPFDISDEKYLLSPEALTMDRLERTPCMTISQSSSLFCRPFCFQPSMNFIIRSNASNVETNNAQHIAESHSLGDAWIHEEATLEGRSISHCCPGARQTRFVVHSGPIPQALLVDDQTCCNCNIQHGLTSPEFDSLDPNDIGNVEFYHEKLFSNGITCGLGDKRCPCCCNLPYLETMDPTGKKIGESRYICDMCLFVPKVDVFDEHDNKVYRLRPDTCCGGCCVLCRCGGEKGRCLRVPWVIRDPNTNMPLKCSQQSTGEDAQVTSLWTGLKRACQKKEAYFLNFPETADKNMKATLTGTALLIDMSFSEDQN